MKSPFLRLLPVPVFLAAPLISASWGGPVTWQEPFEVTAATDIKNPAGATLKLALYFRNTDGPEDQTINGIPFAQGAAEVPDLLSSNMTSGPTAGNGTFFTGTTDDDDLTALLDSHSYNAGNPGNASITLLNLTVGATYQVQLVGVSDDRDCCAGRIYELDDGTGNFEIEKTLQRGLHQSVIGTFAATGETQTIQIRSLGAASGNSDPGLSGLILFQTVASTDTDGDGLPDAWETQYGLNPNAADSNGNGTPDGQEDGDADGLKNVDELGRGTDPVKADTDGDGLIDGVETKTGEWVSETNTGTDPLNPDSDGDGLLDGAEKFQLANGSDPNAVDTDGDFFADGVEVAAGSNPKDSLSTPGGLKIESLGTGTEALLGNDATDPEGNGDDSAGGEGVGFNWVAVTSTSGAVISFDGEGALSVFDNRAANGTDKWCCDGAPQDLTVEFPAGLALTHFTVTSGNDAPGRDPAEWSISGSNDGENFTPIAELSTLGLWTQRLEVIKFTLGTPAPQYKFIRYAVTAQSGDTLHQIAEIEYFGTSTDTDGDGMPDGYEDANGLDKNSAADKTTDKDGDGLTNFEEFTRGTNPQKMDTDDDGLSDKVETGTGEWFSADNTGTNPLKADTDGDGLSDGVENPDKPFTGPAQTGSDPNKMDTDGDLFTDGAEVAANSNPNDPASTPGGLLFEVLGNGTESLLGADLTDPEDDLDDSTDEGFGFNWAFTSSSTSGKATFAAAEGALNIFDNKVGGGEAKWCCENLPQEVTVEFAAPVALTHFTISSSNDSPDRDPTIWGVYGSNDGETFTPILEVDTGAAGLWTERNQVIRFNLNAPAPAYKYIQYMATAVAGAGVLAIGEIEYFGTGGSGGGSNTGFAITGISRNPETGAITLTWTSTPGKIYAIKYSADLATPPNDLGANFPAAAEPATTTSHTFPNPGPAAGRLFFRVVQQP